MREQIFNLISIILKDKKVLFTTSFLSKSIDAHKHSNPFISIEKILNEYFIENMVVKISAKELKEITTPALTIINENELVLLKKIEEDKITYIDTNNRIKVEVLNEFLKKWKTLTLLIGTDDTGFESGYINNIYKEKFEKLSKRKGVLLVTGTIIFGIVLTCFSSFNLIILSKILGLITSVLLIRSSNGYESSLIKSVCESSSITSCTGVLNSKSSQLLGVKLVDIVFFYFSLTSIIILIGSILNDTFFIALTRFLNLLAIPLTLYSIFYQFKLKKLCVLCNVILVVLWLEVYFLYRIPIDFTGLNIKNVISLLFIALLIISSLVFINNYFKHKYLFEQADRKLQLLLKDNELLSSVIENGSEISGLEYDNMEILSENSLHQIVIVVRHDCEPCSHAYKSLKQLMDYMSPYVSLKVVLLTNVKNKDSEKAVAKIFDFFKKHIDLKTRRKFMDSYFDIKNDSKKLKVWLEENNTIQYEYQDKFTNDIKWAKSNNINYTPFFIINNKKVNKNISVEEITLYLKNKLLNE